MREKYRDALADQIAATLRAIPATRAVQRLTLFDDSGALLGEWTGEALAPEVVSGSAADAMVARSDAEGRRVLCKLVGELISPRARRGALADTHAWRWNVRAPVDEARSHDAALISVADLERLLAPREAAAHRATGLLIEQARQQGETINRVLQAVTTQTEALSRILAQQSERTVAAVRERDEAVAMLAETHGLLEGATRVQEDTDADRAEQSVRNQVVKEFSRQLFGKVMEVAAAHVPAPALTDDAARAALGGQREAAE